MTKSFGVQVESWLLQQADDFIAQMCDPQGNWSMRAFIDTHMKLYPMTVDTKVISKVVEIMLMPLLIDGVKSQGWTVELAKHQNHYPDITIRSDQGMVAVDLKTTYIVDGSNPQKVNGFTLGAFTGYFRDRNSIKNSVYPYGEYDRHLVLGVIYRRHATELEYSTFSLEQLSSIPPVLLDVCFLVKPKYAIASDTPGSGNTKNIGSIKDLNNLLHGLGPFMQFEDPEAVFDDYWMHYMTKDMAKNMDSNVPYTNLSRYLDYKTTPATRSDQRDQ